PEQPGAKGRLAPEARERVERAKERLLNGIFRVLTVAQDPVAQSDQGRLMRPQQLVQGGTVPGQSAPDQRPLGGGAAFRLTHRRLLSRAHHRSPHPSPLSEIKTGWERKPS